MNRTDRLQAILTQLQSKNVVKAQEIANRFEISLRTVYRDIRALEEGGIPIGSEAGLGYFLDDSYSLPPIMFTTEEASAILMASKIIPHLSDAKVNDAFQNALYKIKSVMKSEDKEILEKLDHSVKVYSEIAIPNKKASIFIQDIQQALVQSKVIHLSYFSGYKQERSSREVEPIGLVFYALNWHLIAYCRLRKDFRDFRLNRIEQLDISQKSYQRKLDHSFENYMKKKEEEQKYTEIELKVSKQKAHLINDSKYWFGFLEEKEIGEYIHMKFLNAHLKGFARWVVSMTDMAEIQSPKAAQDILLDMVKKLCEKYKTFL